VLLESENLEDAVVGAMKVVVDLDPSRWTSRDSDLRVGFDSGSEGFL